MNGIAPEKTENSIRHYQVNGYAPEKGISISRYILNLPKKRRISLHIVSFPS
jgi:hypothetical protein